MACDVNTFLQGSIPGHFSRNTLSVLRWWGTKNYKAKIEVAFQKRVFSENVFFYDRCMCSFDLRKSFDMHFIFCDTTIFINGFIIYTLPMSEKDSDAI